MERRRGGRRLERLHAESPDNAEVNALLERLKQPADAPR